MTTSKHWILPGEFESELSLGHLSPSPSPSPSPSLSLSLSLSVSLCLSLSFCLSLCCLMTPALSKDIRCHV